MYSRTLVRRAIPATVITLAFAISSAAAFGQDSEEVRIQGMPAVVTASHSRTGIENESVRMSQNISYSDLDLSTPSGRSELQDRIRDTANAICDQLEDYYRSGSFLADQQDTRNCVNTAVDHAMGQMRQVIAAEQTESH